MILLGQISVLGGVEFLAWTPAAVESKSQELGLHLEPRHRGPYFLERTGLNCAPLVGAEHHVGIANGGWAVRHSDGGH